jgi:outer membrane murein-binding lipoprotein Lpp
MSDDDELDIDGAVATRAPAFVAGLDDDEAVDDLQLDDLDRAPDARVDQLEAAVQKLAAQQVASEQQRMRRKVKAATGGASLAGFIPIGLQLIDTLNVTAEVASTIAAAAGALGALLAGYLTPERQAPASPMEVLTP